MSFKKKMLALAAAGAITAATAVPAMALENEFHGMYRVFGFATNAETGGATFNLQDNAKETFFLEQRARLMYIAKANDHLKLVTHFELDSRFGGQDTATTSAGASNATGASNKYPIGDAGALDADRLILEMKNVYLDFDIPQTPVNMKVGVQPWNDAFQGIFGNIDGAGVVASAKVGAFTPTLGWFRLADNNYFGKGITLANTTATSPEIMPGRQTLDMVVVDGKFNVSKDLNVGASYYFVQNDMGPATTNAAPSSTILPSATASRNVDYKLLHMLGANASAKVGPATLSAFAAYQLGDFSTVGTTTRDLSAYAGSVMAKLAVGPGTLSATALYLSGEKDINGSGAFRAFRQLAPNGTVSYFAPANMWLLIRNSAMINSSTAIGGTDLVKGNHGLMGLFAGYEVTRGKVIASANVGYGQAAMKRGADSGVIGTEVNATVGYKLYDNLTASLTGAYLVLGDGINKSTGTVLDSGTAAGTTNLGVANATNPYLAALQLSYAF
jgi:hypothetical protein